MKLRALKDLPTSVNLIQKGQEFIEEVEQRALDWISTGYAEKLTPPPLRAKVATPPLSTPGPEAFGAPAAGLPIWAGCTVAIIASGESLSTEQCAQVEEWRAMRADARVIAINTSFRRAPFADILYACDGVWWRTVDPETRVSYFAEARKLFPLESLWTQDETAAKEFSLRFIASRRGADLSMHPGVVAQGANSAIQAMNLAVHFGTKRFILLGVDGRGKHWHADHPSPLSNSLPHRAWRGSFKTFAADLSAQGIDTVNCSPGTAVEAFRLGDLTEELAK